MEYRAFRAAAEEADGKLSGLAAPFGSETTIGDPKRGGWREEIAPGAFKKALREGDTVLLCDHDMSKPLARVSAGTLRLRETDEGLRFDADPADTSYARDTVVNVRAGNKGGMSIGFVPVKDEWLDDDGEPSDRMSGTRRIIREVKLPEVSVVTNPAYKDTSVFARDELLAEREERAGSKPYGDVKYADPKNGKYPIDTEEHVRAAWSYINMPKNAAKYPMGGVSLESVKAKIRAAAKKFGIKISDSRDDEPQAEADPYEDEFYEREAPQPDEGRDDPDGKEYAAIDKAVSLLAHEPPDIKGALSVLHANQAQRSQEPDTSTPDDDANFALRVAEREAAERSRDLGFVGA